MLVLRIALVLGVVIAVSAKAGRQRECNGDECTCVNKKGKPLYKGIKFPASENYDCKTRPRKCLKKKFGALLKDKPAPVCDSKGFYEPKQCTTVEEPNPCDPLPANAINCGSVKIQSKNYGDYFFGSDNNFDFKISKAGYQLNVVSPGLTGEEGTVSFQSSSEPNKYLRHYGFILYLEDRNGRNAHIFPQDATFKIIENKWFPGFVTFQSVNYPDRFIRHQGYTLKLHPDDGSNLMHNDASFKIIQMTPTAAEPAPIRSAKLQSKNYGDYYFGSDNGFDFKISKAAYQLNIVAPGLTGEEGTVSFQSPAEPNKYLRHYGFILYLEDKNGRNAHIFPQDATFKIIENKWFPGYVTFQSVNYPDRFIRHQGYTLKLHPDDGSNLMHNDASFKIIQMTPTAAKPAPITECWCVTKKKGKEIKNTRGGEDISC